MAALPTRAVFLADAHLSNPDDENYIALLNFLESQSGHLDHLVLLGDIFEFWAGNRRQLLDIYKPFIDQLKFLLNSGTQLTYVEGNHDFDLGRHFENRLKCKILPNGGPIDLDGQKIYLVHGDLANPADFGYRFLRWLLRSFFMRTLIRNLPANIVLKIANQSARSSRSKTAAKRQRWPVKDLLIPYAEEILYKGYSTVLVGHFHQPFRQKVAHGELISLGDWITQYSYVVYENGAFELKHYSGASTDEF
ncbi:MAG: UDP-2,3-diacylglucosamine diphosphatase [Deltaproteobacteria bacterium]|jgi:UDP-2,3-diacylglucosamine hydrolase|nr:UDP-2,3-diacylglucosamine diphosphatase [Deltaproteobacteria bacterium]MBW2504455.1 UDP-2,3-diacylglucosamine diphosphatase [Deltaproteobacteria bacterium]MBW2518972.1 UDP-2,3-diacylglucosamine diphosphatase [Deltaproteobacteria bacterium]